MTKETFLILREIKKEQEFDDHCEAYMLFFDHDIVKESEARFLCYDFSVAAQALQYRFGYDDGKIHTHDEMMKLAEDIVKSRKLAEQEQHFDYDWLS